MSSKIRVSLMEEMHVWAGPVLHKWILRFYMYCFCPCHQVACWVQFGLLVNFQIKAIHNVYHLAHLPHFRFFWGLAQLCIKASSYSCISDFGHTCLKLNLILISLFTGKCATQNNKKNFRNYSGLWICWHIMNKLRSQKMMILAWLWRFKQIRVTWIR